MGSDHESFGVLLRRHRRAAGMTQEELADRSGLSVRGISDLERGARSRPHVDTVEMLASALGLSVRDRALLAQAGRARAPEPRTLAETAAWSGLPTPPNSLLGRMTDLDAIETLFDRKQARLITLTGPGGVGKTRLAIEIALRQRARFPDGVQFVSLAPLRDAELVVPAIAQALTLPENGATPPLEQVETHVRAKRMLLVLDNFEHLLDAASDVGSLLSACPNLAVLTTSRVVLRLTGEYEHQVPPLAFATGDATTSWPPTTPAAVLFVERMAMTAPHFKLGPDDAPAIAEICARLDGLPLAIELAAARGRRLTPNELALRLDRRLALLTDGPRDLPARQRTLRDAIAWSYDLLSPGAKQLLRQLSVFASGWTLDTVELLIDPSETSVQAEVGDLGELVDSSLVLVQRSAAGHARYRMLETIREFAEDHLIELGEEPAARDRHAAAMVDFSERVERGLQSGERSNWSIRSVEELDDVRAALRWLIDQRDAERALLIVGNLDWFWDVVARDREGWAWTERALALPGIDRAGLAYARALNVAGALIWNLGDFIRSDVLLTESVACLRALDDGRSLGQALMNLGLTKQYLGQPAAARAAVREAIGLLERAGDPWGQALALFAFAETLAGDDPDAARDAYQQSLALFRAMNEPWGIAQAISGLGGLAMRQRDYASARAMLEEGLTIRRATGNEHAIAISLTSLGELARREGEPARALPLLTDGLARFRDLSDGEHIAWTLDNLALALLALGSLDAAASAFEECLTLRAEQGNHEQIARTIAGIARLALARGHAADAARLFGAVDAIRARHGLTAPRDEEGDHEARDRSTLAAGQNADGIEQVWRHGQTFDVDAAIRAARDATN